MRGQEQPVSEAFGTFTEEIEVAGGQLVDWVGHLLKDGNIKQIRIKAAGGQLVLEAPESIPGDATTLAPPWLAILGALAALVQRVKIDIVRIGVAPADEIAALWGDESEVSGP